MNLIFADIRGLTLDLQAPAEIDPADLRRLPDGAGSSFDPASAGSRQVVEFNTFFDQLGPRQPAPEQAVAVPAGDARGEYLANAPVGVTTDGERALLRPATVAAEPRVMDPATGPRLAALSGSAGGSLPPGGNSLPGPRPVAPPGSVAAGTGPAIEAPAMPTDAAASATRAPLDAATARRPSPARLEPVPRSEAQFDPARAGAAPARAAESLPAAQLALAGAKRNAAGAEFLTDARPTTQSPATATPAPPPAIAGTPSANGAPTGANAFELVAASASAQRRPDVAPARPAPLPGHDGRAAAAAETLAAPPRGHATGAEPALAMSPRASATAPLVANGAVEITPGDAFAAANRGPEAAMTSLPAGGSAGAAPATPASSSPVASNTGLPPHLESLALPRQAGAADWGNGLGERVGWMIDRRQNSATIRLDPPMLGKLDVQVRVADDATTITIQAQHAPTRELIEASATRLREFLQESGFQNVNVDVSQRQDQQQARAQVAPDARDDADGAAPEPDHPGPANADREAAGDGANLVDTFA